VLDPFAHTTVGAVGLQRVAAHPSTHSGETFGLNYKISAADSSLSEASDLECKDQAKTEFNNVGFILRVSHNRTLSAKNEDERRTGGGKKRKIQEA